MACESWNEEWVARLYGELADADERRATAHLERCADCRGRMERLAATRGLLQQAAPEIPAFHGITLRRPRGARPVWTFAAGAACALLAFGLGVLSAPYVTGQGVPVSDAGLHGELVRLSERLEELEARPDAGVLTRSLEQRFEDKRARDLQYVVRSMTNAELRTGSWMEGTRQALTYLALKQDPGVVEH